MLSYVESHVVSLIIKETSSLCHASISKLETHCVLVRNGKYMIFNILTDAGEIRICHHIYKLQAHIGVQPCQIL